MNRIDREILFTSLGFLAVILRDEMGQDDCAKRARGIAWLIEEFCRNEIPEAFTDDPVAPPPINDEEKCA